jgi:hypothetical protein
LGKRQNRHPAPIGSFCSPVWINIPKWKARTKKSISIPANQTELLNALHEVREDIIVVLSCDSVVETSWLNKMKGFVKDFLQQGESKREVFPIFKIIFKRTPEEDPRQDAE